jgi:serine/threonine protein kinase
MASTADQNNEYEMLQQIEGCGYEAIEKKGGGSYGVVWGVIDDGIGRVAYKYIAPYNYEDYGFESLNEVDISTRIDHPYLAHAYKIVTARDCKIEGLALLLPEGDRGTLTPIAGNKIPGVTFEHKLLILYQLATALEFLHRNNILHLDIKLDNVVLKGDTLHPYLIDFGLSMIVDDINIGFFNSSKFVTISYRAPEILRGGRQYNGAVDVWSFGIMMLYMFTGEEYHNIREIHRDDPTVSIQLSDFVTKFSNPDSYTDILRKVPPQYFEAARDFFLSVLNMDPAKRLTASQIVNHPIFDLVRFQVDGVLIEPTLKNPNIYDYSQDHQQIVNMIIYWSEYLYSDKRAELLFLAIDLYARTASMFKNPADYNQRISLAATCLWVAAKLIRTRHYKISDYIRYINPPIPTLKVQTFLTNNDILQSEINIVNRLDGRLQISELYRSCRNSNELAISLKYVIGYGMPDHDPTLYSRTKVLDWITYIRDPANNWIMQMGPLDKEIQINQLTYLAIDIHLA